MTTLHLLGLPHTVTNAAHSHCAFTGKILRFPAMMRPLGYHVVHYGVEGARTEAQEHVTVMSREEQLAFIGPRSVGQPFGDLADRGSPLYKEFNRRLRCEILERVRASDLVLLPFGWGHDDAVKGLPITLVESGIGYNDLYPGARHKVFESFAWMHYHQGKANRQGSAYEWVVPNYFDVNEWDVVLEPPTDRVVYLGRLTKDKGLDTVVEIAKRRPEITFTLCGQGDPKPWLTFPNIVYREPITGRARSEYLGQARCVLMPTEYTEPFGGVAVEAQLCGTPAITSAYGAFTETVVEGVTGFRCRTLADYLAAVDQAGTLNRRVIAAGARGLYGLERVGHKYDQVFRQIRDLFFDGWYTT
jgi:glycosyltransferase involved in cell wall biosynthesis